MSQSASQAAAFYREVAASGELWLLEDGDGQVPVSRSGDAEVTPAFSSERRARKAVARWSGGEGLTPARYAWDAFCEDLGAVLEREGVHVGVNWTGERLTGYDVPMADLRENVRAAQEPGTP